MKETIIDSLNWRYATKLFDSEKKIPDADIDTLLEATRLAPSSLGVQPWRAYVVTSSETRMKLKEAAWNQPQITDASHIIIFAARKDMSETYVESYLKNVASVRNQKREDLTGYKNMILGSASGKTPVLIKEWNARQAYIALGFLLETAALLKIDACPMEGFDSKQFDAILKLENTDYTSVVIAAIGYRSGTDIYALAKKVRFCKDELFTRV